MTDTENTDQQQLENAVPAEAIEDAKDASAPAPGPAIDDPTGRVAPADHTEASGDPLPADENLSVEQRRTAEMRKREVIRTQAMEPVREKIEQQLRESGHA